MTRHPSSPEPPGMTASKNAIHRATVTTKMLAVPDAVYCSAQTTKALPPPSNSTPTIAWVRQSDRSRGSLSPNARANPSNSTPATRKRSPANRNGGSSPTPTLMARYVDPQNTHTTRYAISALPRRAAMSVGLHRDEARLFEHGAEHDRGARAHLHLRGRPAQVPQDALQALEIRCRDLQDAAVFARDMMTLEHARVLLQVAHPWFIADVVGVRIAHGDEGRDRETSPPAIHSRVVAGDVTRLLESLHPLHHRGPGQADLVSDRLVARAPVGAEDAQDLAVDGVQLMAACHFAVRVGRFPTIRNPVACFCNPSQGYAMP